MTSYDYGYVYREGNRFGLSDHQIRLALAVASPATGLDTEGNYGVDFGTIFGIPMRWLNRHGWYADDVSNLQDDYKMFWLASARETNWTWFWVVYNTTTERVGRHRVPRFQRGSPAAVALPSVNQIVDSFAGGTGAGQSMANHGWSTVQDFCSSWGQNQYSRQTTIRDKIRRQRR